MGLAQFGNAARGELQIQDLLAETARCVDSCSRQLLSLQDEGTFIARNQKMCFSDGRQIQQEAVGGILGSVKPWNRRRPYPRLF